MKTGTECSKCFHTLIDKGDCDCFCHTLLTPPEDRFMKKARILTDMWISRGGPTLDEFTKMISDALREQEEETIKGRANVSVAIADCGHPQEMKLMMLLCKGCEHWNQLEKIKTLQSRIEKLEKVILKYVLHDKDCTLQQNRGARPALDVSHCNCGLNEALSNEKEKE